MIIGIIPKFLFPVKGEEGAARRRRSSPVKGKRGMSLAGSILPAPVMKCTPEPAGRKVSTSARVRPLARAKSGANCPSRVEPRRKPSSLRDEGFFVQRKG